MQNVTNLVEAGDAIIVDGSTGDVKIRPVANVEAAYADKARLRARRQERYRKLRDVPAVTQDGVAIGLHMNAGLLIDVPHVVESGAKSIGLFRTELQFMVASRFPRTNEQYALYKAVMDAIPDRDVTFRTLDIGGDKILPYMAALEERNPALGWRAIRIGLDRPALLRSQLRAMLRAGAGRNLSIMFPMIATTDEFDRARAHVGHEMSYLEAHGYKPPARLKLGVMVEVPSLLWQLEEIAARVDFLSVGSNDLVQYIYAADRDNKRMAGRFDVLSTPVLRALRQIAAAALKADVPFTLCGEIGGKPLEALALIALGYRSFSMSPSSIGRVKAMVLAAHAGRAAEFLTPLVNAPAAPGEIREKLEKFVREQQIPI